MSELVIRSHVGRDILQSAQLFRSDYSVVWEYVSNSLQYTDEGVSPKVVVTLDSKGKAIRILDNGRGMDRSDLSHFFTMHAENRDRAEGRIGRGMFGTGKSAAFAIADTLVVTSTRDGLRNKVRVDREDIEASDGSEVPVKVLEEDKTTSDPNGTMVEILRVRLKKVNREAIVRYTERNLARYPADVEVYVDHHQCRYVAPEIDEQFEFGPDSDLADVLGDIKLIVKVSRRKLEEDLRGIQVFSHGNWHESTLAGSEGREMSEYLFGEVEVPAIEEYDGPIRPFDISRSGRLNPQNEVVAALYRFIGPKVDGVRRELVRREKERRQSEESRRLQEQADELARVLSEDFSAFQAQLRRVRSAVLGRDVGRRFADFIGDPESERLTEGGDVLATKEIEPRSDAAAEPHDATPQPPSLPPPVTPSEEATTTGGGVKEEEGGRSKSPRGGLSIQMENMGETEARGRYLLEERTIYINLDHPQVAAAHARGAEDPAFLRLAAEVALSEYAIALAQELADTYSTPDEPIFDIHETVDRVARQFAGLYAGDWQ